jgi:hypothetical protein
LAIPTGVFAADDLRPPLLVPVGLSASVGGGIVQFVDGRANALAPIGGSWTARLTFGTQSPVGAEIAYLGSAQSVSALGLDDHAFLLGTGVEGLVRLNGSSGPWQPFLTAGIGWRHYNLHNTLTNTSTVSSSDNMLEVPVAMGVAYRFQTLVIDGRAELRPAFLGKLITGASLMTWQFGARLGWEL